jgi:hypothetical protein
MMPLRSSHCRPAMGTNPAAVQPALSTFLASLISCNYLELGSGDGTRTRGLLSGHVPALPRKPSSVRRSFQLSYTAATDAQSLRNVPPGTRDGIAAVLFRKSIPLVSVPADAVANGGFAAPIRQCGMDAIGRSETSNSWSARSCCVAAIPPSYDPLRSLRLASPLGSEMGEADIPIRKSISLLRERNVGACRMSRISAPRLA